jgi:hypothetical protein
MAAVTDPKASRAKSSVKAAGRGLPTQGRHKLRRIGAEQGLEGQSEPDEPANVLDPNGGDHAVSWTGRTHDRDLFSSSGHRTEASRGGAALLHCSPRLLSQRTLRGTTFFLQDECGASTPWNRRSGRRGGGTSAASRARNWIGSITRWVSLPHGLRIAYATRPSGSALRRSRLSGGRAQYRRRRSRPFRSLPETTTPAWTSKPRE